MAKIIVSKKAFNYENFFQCIKNKITDTRINFSRQANRAINGLYWFIGQIIVENQAKQGWGKGIVTNLSKDLKNAFPDVKFGFSERNLWDMRRFFLAYQDKEKLRRFVAEIAWGANLVIINKVKDIKAREYYLKATLEMGWTRNILTFQINSQAYERHYLENKTHNFNSTLPKHLAEQADKTMKSIYSLEMLGMAKPVLENELKRNIVSKIKNVLLEFGCGFTFIGDEYRLVAPNGAESYIDLLFFHRRLQALVAVELKTGRFKPEYVGKMNYYLGLLDDQVKEPWENASFGMILCASRDHIDVEYALRDFHKPIGVAEYQFSKEFTKNTAKALPDPKQLEAEILKEIDIAGN